MKSARILLLILALPAFCDSREIRLDVPYVKQPANGCGAAAISMVMQYWQLQESQRAAIDVERVQKELYVPRARGIFASEMQSYFRRHGYRAFAFHGDVADLAHHLELGRPLIVALATAGSHHYVVVAGLDEERSLLVVNDPAERKMLIRHIADFEKEWDATNRWTLLAVPEGSGQ